MIPSVTVDISRATGRLDRMPEQVRSNLRRVLPALAKALGATVESNMAARLQSHTHLKVQKHLVENPKEIYARVTLVWTGVQAKKLVPHWLEEGTKPHVIEARNANVLAFYWPKIGDWFFGPRVNHPGNKAYKIFGDAVAQRRPEIQRAIELAVREAVMRP